MESLKENKPLLYSILFSASAVVVLACRIMPEFSDQFQIVEFPDDVRKIYSSLNMISQTFKLIFFFSSVQLY